MSANVNNKKINSIIKSYMKEKYLLGEDFLNDDSFIFISLSESNISISISTKTKVENEDINISLMVVSNTTSFEELIDVRFNCLNNYKKADKIIETMKAKIKDLIELLYPELNIKLPIKIESNIENEMSLSLKKFTFNNYLKDYGKIEFRKDILMYIIQKHFEIKSVKSAEVIYEYLKDRYDFIGLENDLKFSDENNFMIFDELGKLQEEETVELIGINCMI